MLNFEVWGLLGRAYFDIGVKQSDAYQREFHSSGLYISFKNKLHWFT